MMKCSKKIFLTFFLLWPVVVCYALANESKDSQSAQPNKLNWAVSKNFKDLTITLAAGYNKIDMGNHKFRKNVVIDGADDGSIVFTNLELAKRITYFQLKNGRIDLNGQKLIATHIDIAEDCTISGNGKICGDIINRGVIDLRSGSDKTVVNDCELQIDGTLTGEKNSKIYLNDAQIEGVLPINKLYIRKDLKGVNDFRVTNHTDNDVDPNNLLAVDGSVNAATLAEVDQKQVKDIYHVSKLHDRIIFTPINPPSDTLAIVEISSPNDEPLNDIATIPNPGDGEYPSPLHVESADTGTNSPMKIVGTLETNHHADGSILADMGQTENEPGENAGNEHADENSDNVGNEHADDPGDNVGNEHADDPGDNTSNEHTDENSDNAGNEHVDETGDNPENDRANEADDNTANDAGNDAGNDEIEPDNIAGHEPGDIPFSDTAAALRPEAGIYAANMATANTLFATRMHDRIGEPTFPSTIEGMNDTSGSGMWLRVVGGHNKTHVMGGRLATRTHTQLVQGGGEIRHWTRNGIDGLHLGVMIGAGKSQSHSRVGQSGLAAQGGISGYSTGLYGNWHTDDSRREGLYVDGSLSYNWFGNDVRLKDNANERNNLSAQAYRTQGFVGSLEGGYTWQFFDSEQVDAFIQPQLQVTWMGVSAKDRRDGQGSHVAMLGENNIQTRIGSRLFMRGHASQDKGKQRVFQPYIETNWLHNTKTLGVQIDNVRYVQTGTQNIGEIKLGTEGQINPNLALWGSVGQQVGGGGFRGAMGSLGVKVNF